MSYWLNDEDLQNDLNEMSAFCNPVAPKPSPEPSEFKKKLCGKPSMYEMDMEEDEQIPEKFMVLPVRGHPLLQNGIRKPGGRPTTDIREACGFGYSNDIIEHGLKTSNSEDERDPEKMKNLSFESPSPQKVKKKSDYESDGSTNLPFQGGLVSMPSCNMGWSNDDDIRSDMLKLSKFYKPFTPESSPEFKIKEKCDQPSMHEINIDADEEVPVHSSILSIQGDPVLPNDLRKPEGCPTTDIHKVLAFGSSNSLNKQARKTSNSDNERDPEKIRNLLFVSPPRRMVKKKRDNWSDSSPNTSPGSRSNSSGFVSYPDINSKIEFPDLK